MSSIFLIPYAVKNFPNIIITLTVMISMIVWIIHHSITDHPITMPLRHNFQAQFYTHTLDNLPKLGNGNRC